MNNIRPIIRSVLKRCTNEYCDVKYWEACKLNNHLACPSADRRVLTGWVGEMHTKSVATNLENALHSNADLKDKI
jgi:hypothetical protein